MLNGNLPPALLFYLRPKPIANSIEVQFSSGNFYYKIVFLVLSCNDIISRFKNEKSHNDVTDPFVSIYKWMINQQTLNHSSSLFNWFRI